MSKTPRTDEIIRDFVSGDGEAASIMLLRQDIEQLETELVDKDRQLADAKAEIEALKRVNAALNEEIKIQRAYAAGRDNTIERKDKLIEQMRVLLNAVVTRSYYIDCADIDGKNWFDEREVALAAEKE